MSREPSTDPPPQNSPLATASASRFDAVKNCCAWCFATGCGVGLCPIAPGTAGSVFGPILVWGWQQLARPWFEGLAVTVAAIVIGVWASNREARRCGRVDPGHVVCDELVAFTIVFAGVPVNWIAGCLGFVWFRVFDILKPWPIRRLEHFPGGLGIMADDLLAGVFAAAALRATLWCLASF